MLPSGKKYHDSNMLVFVLAAWAVQHQTKIFDVAMTKEPMQAQ